MRIREFTGNVIDGPPESTWLLPIGADYVLGPLGAAFERERHFLRMLNIQRSLGQFRPDAIFANGVLALICKPAFDTYPTLGNLKNALKRAKTVIEYEEIPLISMQPIKCGADGPRWWEAKKLLQETWAPLRVTVDIYYGKERD